MASDKAPLQKVLEKAQGIIQQETANLKRRKIPFLCHRAEATASPHAVLRQSLILNSRAENCFYWIQPPPTTTSLS